MTAERSFMLAVAHAALCEAGHGDLCDYVYDGIWNGTAMPLIKSPCTKPHTVTKAVALAHQAAGHRVDITYLEGHGSFVCDECGLS